MAPPEKLKQIVSQLREMDRPPRQVMLDARIVVMGNADLLNLGLQWDWPTASAGIFSNSAQHEPGENTWPWAHQVGYTPGKEFTNSLVLTLNLLAQHDLATVLANPQVMAQDGEEAEMSVTTEEYFEILTEGYYNRSELEKIEAGTILRITPCIRDNDDITLQMSIEVSDVVARGEDNLPVVTRRLAKSTVRVQNGGTAAIGGLLDTRTRRNYDRVPGLSKAPGIGRLFRNDTRDELSRQVAVFITPRIIPEGESFVGRPPVKAAAVQPVGEEFKLELMQSLSRK